VAPDRQSQVARDAEVAAAVQRVLERRLSPWIIVRRTVLLLLVLFGWFCDLGALIELTSPSSPGGEPFATSLITFLVIAALSSWGTFIIARKGKGPRVHQLLWPTESACSQCGGPLSRRADVCQYCGYPVRGVQDTIEVG
jgi:hypothetical protein